MLTTVLKNNQENWDKKIERTEEYKISKPCSLLPLFCFFFLLLLHFVLSIS